MSAGVNQAFATMARALADQIQDVASKFFVENGLNTGDNANWQSQMTTPILQTAKELLMFGGDAWPLAAFENAVERPFTTAPAVLRTIQIARERQ
jgi:hypothetical protein